jgi:hypothetical protein
VSLPGGTTNHQGAQFEEARIESSDERNQTSSFITEAFENVLIDKEERLDRSCAACAVDNRKISVLEAIPESIVQNLVIPVIFSLVGERRRPGRASGKIDARNNGNRERFTTRAGSVQTNGAHLYTPQALGIYNPAQRELFPASRITRW